MNLSLGARNSARRECEAGHVANESRDRGTETSEHSVRSVPVSRERCALPRSSGARFERAMRPLAIRAAAGPAARHLRAKRNRATCARRYGFLVGFGAGGCVGIGVRPPGGEVVPGGTPVPGEVDGATGFGAKPQMLQLKRP